MRAGAAHSRPAFVRSYNRTIFIPLTPSFSIKTTIVTLVVLPKADTHVVVVNKALPKVTNVCNLFPISRSSLWRLNYSQLPVGSDFIRRLIEATMASYMIAAITYPRLPGARWWRLHEQNVWTSPNRISSHLLAISQGCRDRCHCPPYSPGLRSPRRRGTPRFRRISHPFQAWYLLFLTRIKHSKRPLVFEGLGARDRPGLRRGSEAARVRFRARLGCGHRSADNVFILVRINLLKLMRVKGEPRHRRMGLPAVKDKPGEKHGRAGGVSPPSGFSESVRHTCAHSRTAWVLGYRRARHCVRSSCRPIAVRRRPTSSRMRAFVARRIQAGRVAW